MKLCNLDEIINGIRQEKNWNGEITEDALNAILDDSTEYELRPVVTCYNCRFFRNREQECGLFNRRTTSADFCSKGQ